MQIKMRLKRRLPLTSSRSLVGLAIRYGQRAKQAGIFLMWLNYAWTVIATLFLQRLFLMEGRVILAVSLALEAILMKRVAWNVCMQQLANGLQTLVPVAIRRHSTINVFAKR